MRLSVTLDGRAHEMAQEEIQKQVAYLSSRIANVRFTSDGQVLECDVPDSEAAQLERDVRDLAGRLQKSLRRLERKIIFRSAAADRSPVRPISGKPAGIHALGTGQVALEGVPLALFRYFDRVFAEMGDTWDASPILTPTLIPTRVLSRCDYFRSFPQNVTFASHLHEDLAVIDSFRSRHEKLDDLDANALADMDVPRRACRLPCATTSITCIRIGLSPHREPRTRSAASVSATRRATPAICAGCGTSRCAKSSSWAAANASCSGAKSAFARCRTSSTRTSWRARSEPPAIRSSSRPMRRPRPTSSSARRPSTRVSLMLPGNERVAVGSLNYHTDFFGRAFAIDVDGSGPMHSVCIAFGLERWVHAFLAQHGVAPADWPEVIREAPEFRTAVLTA